MLPGAGGCSAEWVCGHCCTNGNRKGICSLCYRGLKEVIDMLSGFQKEHIQMPAQTRVCEGGNEKGLLGARSTLLQQQKRPSLASARSTLTWRGPHYLSLRWKSQLRVCTGPQSRHCCLCMFYKLVWPNNKNLQCIKGNKQSGSAHTCTHNIAYAYPRTDLDSSRSKWWIPSYLAPIPRKNTTLILRFTGCSGTQKW